MKEFEGRKKHPYVDAKGVLTIGRGNNINNEIFSMSVIML
jgi:GH24 family phage-related lysozyme (muramidase)